MTLEPGRNQPTSAEAEESAFSRTEEAWDIYRLLIENSYDLVAELDPLGEFIYVNPSYQKSLGFLPADLLQKNAFDFIHPQDIEKARREFKQPDGTTILRFRHLSGAWRWFDCSFRQFETPAGSRTVLISRDISARKEAEIKFDVLASLGSRLSSTRTMVEAARIIADAARTLCGWDAFSLDLYNAPQDLICPVLMIDEIDGKPTEIAILQPAHPPSPFARMVIQDGAQRTQRKGNDFDPDLRPFGDQARASASLLFVPIVESGETLGIVSIQSYRINAYSRSDLKILQVLAGHCSGTLGRIRAMDQLRDSQARFEAFMEHTPAAAWIKDESGRYLYANHLIEELFKRARSEIVSRTDRDFLPASVAEQLQAQDRAIRETGLGSRAEGSLLPGDTRQWFVSQFPFLSPSGRKLVGGLAFDITDQVHLQRLLRASEDRFRTLFEAAPVAIGLVRDGELLFTNFAFRQMFQLPAEAACADRPFLENIAASSREEVREYFARKDAAASLAATEVRGLRTGGGEFPCILQIAPVELQEGRAHLAFLVDISEKRALEAQLFQSQKMESIGRLAGGIAHDFANLLTVIHGHAARIERGIPNPAPSLDGIIRAAHKATELTKQLLAFSRRQTLQIVEVDVNGVVGETGRMIERVLGEDITLRLHLAPGLPPILGDQMLLEQLVLNLAVTSRDSMHAGGNLTITTSYLPPGKLSLTGAIWEKGAVCLRVEDTGRGFRKEDLPHIFEPFFQTSAGTGVALRLATVYGIVKQHNGNIEVTSEIGSGTSFAIAFPSAVLPAIIPSKPVTAVSAGTILIVEDSNDLRMMLRDLLVDCGYNILEAASSAHATQIFAAHRDRLDLVIADVFLEDGSGRELVRRFRAEKPELRAIITTGYDPHQIRGQMDLQKNELFLAKPFQTDDLLNAIEALQKDRGNPR
jgi:two-component system, cell cycle sensor histidine kinase and response regulator CckA